MGCWQSSFCFDPVPACIQPAFLVIYWAMPDYDLRSAFPLNDKQFVAHHQTWICRLAEVSDLRPGNDRLSWYLVFEPTNPGTTPIRKLEVVTAATHLLQAGFGDDLTDRISEWLLSDEQDGRVEWLDY